METNTKKKFGTKAEKGTKAENGPKTENGTKAEKGTNPEKEPISSRWSGRKLRNDGPRLHWNGRGQWT